MGVLANRQQRKADALAAEKQREKDAARLNLAQNRENLAIFKMQEALRQEMILIAR